MKRRPNGMGTEPTYHAGRGRWLARVTIGLKSDGTPIRREVSDDTREGVIRKRDELRMRTQVAKSNVTPERRRDLTRLSNRTGLYLVPSEDGHVYFIGAPNGLVKIGHAIDVYNRLSKHQVGSPLPLTLIAAVPGTRDVEQALHVINAGRWSHGEWFAMTEDEAKTWAAKCVVDVLGVMSEAAERAKTAS